MCGAEGGLEEVRGVAVLCCGVGGRVLWWCNWSTCTIKLTIHELEPNSVLPSNPFPLTPPQMPNLVVYLEHLHDRGLATREHTTLLLNCYSHLGDEGKLGQFICGDADMAKVRDGEIVIVLLIVMRDG